MTLEVTHAKTTDAVRLADSVYMTLLEAILSGRLTPGMVVSELALSRELKVSRTPVHDALRQLGKDGLVQQETRRRAMIVAVSREDVQDIFEMRRLLETEAARRAATRMDRQTLAQLRAMADELAQGKRDRAWMQRWADFDEQCHATIARASGSARLASDIARYRLLHRGLNQIATTVEVLEQAFEEHLRILEALDRRDSKAAAHAMEEHIREWQAYFVNHFPQ
jgi:GntR family transcriptional regulator, rspAB operon transcriptional repressor